MCVYEVTKEAFQRIIETGSLFQQKYSNEKIKMANENLPSKFPNLYSKHRINNDSHFH